MISRRAFVAGLTGGLLAAPLAAGAQQAGKVHRIAYLTVPSRESAQGVANTFSLGLRDLGWIEGQNVVVEYRFAASNLDRLSDLAAELVTGRAPNDLGPRSGDASVPILGKPFSFESLQAAIATVLARAT